MNYKSIILLIITFFIISCNNDKHTTTISGNIPNLPDGTLYLYQEKYNNIIDSTHTQNGKFKIIHKWENYTEPIYLGIDHIDNNKIKRSFSFITNAKYKGSGCQSQYFFSDSIISINGNLKEFETKDIILQPRYKIVTAPKISAGMQTKALYNTDCDLFDDYNVKSFSLIKDKIKEYTYSYHLLYNINDNKNSFSTQQIDEFLKLFKGEITQNKTFRNLSAYNKKRFTEKNTSLPSLENISGEKSAILDSKYKKNLVVFWASWCGPCRQEIPLLKKMYSKKDESIEFISISIDDDKNAWKKALSEEKMDWKQLIINDKDPNYEKIQMHFRLNGAIPYTVLLDNNSKILKSTVGLSSEKDLQDFIESK